MTDKNRWYKGRVGGRKARNKAERVGREGRKMRRQKGKERGKRGETTTHFFSLVQEPESYHYRRPKEEIVQGIPRLTEIETGKWGSGNVAPRLSEYPQR